jgi:hypothetical protein
MPELEDRLTSLATTIDWPPTPRFLPIHAEVARQAPEGAARRRGIPRWALLAAAVLLVVAAVAFTWLNLHTTVYRVPNPPTPTPRSPGVLGSSLGLGTPAISVADAQRQVPWKVVMPSTLGLPDAVYVKLAPNGGPSQGEVTLVYASAPGIQPSGQTGVAVLVTEARGRVNEIYFQKVLGPEATVEQLTVGGHSGYWISGHPHDFLFVGADGQVQDDSLRLATNTLILDDNGTIVRVEGDMTKDQALAIAASLT